MKFTESEANELATVDLPQGYLNLSLKAAKKILPQMLKDKVYSDACNEAGFNHTNPNGELPTLDRLPFPSEDQIPHAVVRTSVRSAVRILNALHEEYGKPDAIHIELPRDLAKSAKARLQEEQEMDQKQTVRRRIMQELVKIRQKPNRDNVHKVQLWEELGGNGLPMEPNVVISDITDLFRGGYDVCHIVPRGHSLDNSMGNLFLGTEKFNRQYQGSRIPYEAFRQNGDEATWNRQILPHVKSLTSMPLYKRNKLLIRELPEDFTGRHLAATGWLSREVLKLAQQMVSHKPNAVVVPGRATSEFRKFWGLDNLVPLHPNELAEKQSWKQFLELAEAGKATDEDVKKAKIPGSKGRSNFKHHALDALVVALTTRATLQALATYAQMRDSWDESLVDQAKRKEMKVRAMPDPELRAKAERALASAEIVHRPNRRPSGSLNKEGASGEMLGKVTGTPRTSKVLLEHKRLIRFDHEGRAAQSYMLGSNHHCTIWERTTPDKKGEFERIPEVVATIEAVRRRNLGEPVIHKTTSQPGLRYLMSLVQGDIVEMADGRIAEVRMFSQTEKSVDLELWEPYVAAKLGPNTEGNPYFIKRIRNNQGLQAIVARVVLDPLGRHSHQLKGIFFL